MVEIDNFFHCDADNNGDVMCGAGQYIWPTATNNLPLKPTTAEHKNVIIGGGGIFGQLEGVLQSIKRQNEGAKAVGWGVGLPSRSTRAESVRSVVSQFDLFGSRNFDWSPEVTFVPCASCLSPLFDRPVSPSHEVVIYAHKKKGDAIMTPPTVPFMDNRLRPADEVINFLASGELVVTSSYHGVYWAQLLNRKIICVPYGSKFEAFEHMPLVSTAGDWTEKIVSAGLCPPVLEHYREINMAFAEQVADLFNF